MLIIRSSLRSGGFGTRVINLTMGMESDMTANEIFTAVLAAMQAAEELGGPEGREYIELMERIAKEATQRSVNARAVLEE
jgi:aspartate/methionine/tyrosine aminotransferase